MKKTDLIKLTLVSTLILFAGIWNATFAQSNKTDSGPAQSNPNSGTLIANPAGNDAAKMKQAAQKTGNEMQNQPVNSKRQPANAPAQSNKPLVTLPANASPGSAKVNDAPDSEAKKAKIAEENAKQSRKSEQEIVNAFNNEAKQILNASNNYADGKKQVWNILQKHVTDATPVLGDNHANEVLNKAFENQMQLFQERLLTNNKN